MLSQPTTRRSFLRGVILAVILAVHAIFGWVLVCEVSTTRRAVATVVSAIVDVPWQRPPEHLTPLARIQPVIIQSTPLQLPSPLVRIDRPEDPTISVGNGAGSGAGAAAVAMPAHREATLVYSPDTTGFYPLASELHHEQGVVLLLVCLDARSQIIHVEVSRSSRFTRLDVAAVRLAYKTRWNPATLDEKAISECEPMFVSFKDLGAPLT